MELDDDLLELVETLHAQGPERVYQFLVEIAAKAGDPNTALDVINAVVRVHRVEGIVSIKDV